jgi:hypothetical protein
VINKNITKEYFLMRAGAISGLAVELFTRIYDAIFYEAVDLDEIYAQYYSIEYDSLRTFLYHKFCIDNDIIDELMEVKNSNTDNAIIMIDELSYGKSDIITFAFSESMYDRTTNILLMRPYENKD